MIPTITPADRIRNQYAKMTKRTLLNPLSHLIRWLITFLIPLSPLAANPVHHNIQVTLQPEQHRLSVNDDITLPEQTGSPLRFHLHKGLSPTSSQPGVVIEKQKTGDGDTLYDSYTVTLPPGVRRLSLQYSGEIHHPLPPLGGERARGIRSTPGLIDEKGIYLAGSSYWYPVVEGETLLTFTLTLHLPEGWDAISQGSRLEGVPPGWHSPEPQEEIYLIGGRFTRYERNAGRIDTEVWLRTPDEALANRYLDVTGSYLSMYERLIGPYPYPKFAMVENFWETGFGMPSFTLLGPKVIRLPFILHSSYPHEILHNWWGNGVYPDYGSGNWSEGLTAYLADHLIKEQRGKGIEYRRETLQKYAHYVRGGRDFPLVRFRARHSSASEAVGYGKALMLFHMLRLTLGDETFVKGLRQFYRDYRFKTASFDDIRRSFETVSGKDLNDFFRQWTTRTGAPQLKLHDARITATPEGEYRLQTVIEQQQPGAAYRLQVPLAVTLEGKEQAWQTTLAMDDKRLEVKLTLPARPLRLDLDPEFDLFRRLDAREIPPAISGLLGADRLLIVLPSRTDGALRHGYRQLAEALKAAGPERVRILTDDAIDSLPRDEAAILIGWRNRFLEQFRERIRNYPLVLDEDAVQLEGVRFQKKTHSFVITAGTEYPRMWIATDDPAALPGLGRKLPHYHKYSYLAFEGEEPVNVAKGRWPVPDSPLTRILVKGERPKPAALAPREPLATLPAPFSGERMLETIRFLTDPALEGRGFGSKGLKRAAQYIAERFRDAGLKPGGDARYFQHFRARGGPKNEEVELQNVVGIIPGTRPEYEDQSVVIAAHYDHLGRGWPESREERYRGEIHPGADDNASGVAVLLELARTLGNTLKPERSIIFIAFSGEEAGRKGSQHYLANSGRYPNDKCIAMINLDTVGRLGSNKLLVLGAESASEWVHIIRGVGFVTGVEMTLVKEPLDASDQVSFHEAGIPAIQLFSGPNLDYHRPSDTADKIDTGGLVKVATATREILEYLSGREQPLTVTLHHGSRSGNAGPAPETSRKVRLGTIPDFAYSGTGVRLSGVAPGSPAAASGLQEGDVIIRINDEECADIKALSGLLKQLNPGDRITITYLRNGKEQVVEAEVSGR